MSVDFGYSLPQIHTAVPGAVSSQYVEMLSRAECPAITARRARRAEVSGAAQDPIVWKAARGVNVMDADGNVFVDFTAGFGVAAVGHSHPRVVDAVQRQSGTLLHALGDLHPSNVKVDLLSRLIEIAPWKNARVIFGLNGADSVEAAIKTAALFTGKSGVLAFEGGYHGLSYGTLSVCGYREDFRAPFSRQLSPHVVFAPFPHRELSFEAAIQSVKKLWDESSISVGAVLVEPIQGRAGVHVPPAGFLRALSELCKEREALLVCDEVLTGLGRCGARWRSLDDGAVPDVVCVGKALGGGLPISACLASDEIMKAWGDPGREALHTGTFHGNPLACAAALATLDVLEEENLSQRAKSVGESWIADLRNRISRISHVREVRGAGFLVGVQLTKPASALRVVRSLLEVGFLVLPAGPEGDVIQLIPPLSVPETVLDALSHALEEALSSAN